MRLSFNLSDNIQCENICSSIQRLVNKRPIDPQKTLLIIDLVTITDSNDSLIPKIEYKEIDQI